MFVGAIIVHDQMQIESGRSFAVDFLEEADKFLMPVARHTVADHLAVEHAEGREESGCAIAFVIVGLSSTAALLHRQTRLGPVQGLDLTLLVHAQNQGLVWRIQIQPHNIAKLLDKAFVAAELEGLDQMGLEVVLLPYPTYRRFAETLGFGHGSCAPMCCSGGRRVQGCFDHSVDFPWRDSRNATGAGRVFFQSGASEGQKTLPPELNCRTRNPQMTSDVVAEDSIGRHLDDLGALHQAQRKAFPASPEPDGRLFLGG